MSALIIRGTAKEVLPGLTIREPYDFFSRHKEVNIPKSKCKNIPGRTTGGGGRVGSSLSTKG